MTFENPDEGAGMVGEIDVECVRRGAPRKTTLRSGEDISPERADEIVAVVAEIQPDEVWPISLSDALRAVCMVMTEGAA